MYRGHGGLSLLLFSPFMFLFRVSGVDTNLIMLTGLLMAAVSFVPDLDLLVRRFGLRTRHRGITHTLLFGAVAGFVFSAAFAYICGSSGWLMGFTAGFGGTVSHLLGDIFTCEPKVRPFYPFSNREVGLGFFKPEDKTANNTMVALGAIAFTISYLILVSL